MTYQISLPFVPCRIWKENLNLWSLDNWEVTSIMRSSFVLTERYTNLTKSSMMQVTTQDVRMMRKERKTETFGLNRLRHSSYRFVSESLSSIAPSQLLTLSGDQMERLLSADFPVDVAEADILDLVLTW